MKVVEIVKIECFGDYKIITCHCEPGCGSTYRIDYEDHPGTLRFLGDLYVKTGWNSDKHEVYYRV